MMQRRFHPLAAIVFTIVAGLVLACSGTPSVTRTAVVKNISIADDVSPQSVMAHPGDEIRWVNSRRHEVQLDIPRLEERSLNCRRGFSTWFGHLQESMHLGPNESASLCFANPTTVHYVVRAGTDLPGGKELMKGSVSVTH